MSFTLLGEIIILPIYPFSPSLYSVPPVVLHLHLLFAERYSFFVIFVSHFCKIFLIIRLLPELLAFNPQILHCLWDISMGTGL